MILTNLTSFICWGYCKVDVKWFFYLNYPVCFTVAGAGAVKFIICHAEVSIAFVEEKKIVEVLIFGMPCSVWKTTCSEWTTRKLFFFITAVKSFFICLGYRFSRRCLTQIVF